MKQSLFTLFLVFLNCANILAQSPAAAPAQPPSRPISQPPASSPTQVPAGPTPTNVTKILEKAGHFSIFIRLLKSTQEENHLLTVINNSNNGLTIIAPTDNAFSSLKAGTLNVLTIEQKAELVKFHEIPTFLSMSQFQTVTIPVATEAGSGGRVGLNVTSYPASVNITNLPSIRWRRCCFLWTSSPRRLSPPHPLQKQRIRRRRRLLLWRRIAPLLFQQ